ncbi:hypothetical protein ACFFIF_06375 [Vagococcus entomophilus]|uniref:PepSY domain-containing protein n=1 Tax=Vagococcus entomophilus TaxID=1160095 RepID=A0A430AFD7_9ENTE|nr:hypothetical protein [Vagococcus entomophilus]RSU06457.1 hypothetical protein CBF30_09385 [Vagococcus entomophilus]
MEDTAKQILTETYGVSVKGITITEKISKNKYKAIVDLTGDTAGNIIVQYVPSTNKVYVNPE